MDFMKFEAKYFDKLDNITLKIFRNYYYLYEFQIDFNFGFNKTYNTVILKAVIAQ